MVPGGDGGRSYPRFNTFVKWTPEVAGLKEQKKWGRENTKNSLVLWKIQF